ncbi:MAG: hypothetical protein CSB01_04190, partial [Bacteroidia bacterium]
MGREESCATFRCKLSCFFLPIDSEKCRFSFGIQISCQEKRRTTCLGEWRKSCYFFPAERCKKSSFYGR